MSAISSGKILTSLLLAMLTPAVSSPAEQRQALRDSGSDTAGNAVHESGKGEVSFRILVKKSERKLYLYETAGGKERLRKTYRIALGNAPTGHKQRQGDGRTPEGDYYITHKNHKSNFYLSLGVSYPNVNDANEGLKNGLITKRQHEAITAAIQSKSKPPQNTRLGGDIFVHGGGTGKLMGLIRDWTLGCVALENEDIKELFDLLPVKTPVKIVP